MTTPYETRLFEAMRAAIRSDPAGRPLPPGQRRQLSKAEQLAVTESVRRQAIAESRARQRGGFVEGPESGAGPGTTRPRPASVVPGSVAETHPEWLEGGFIDGIVAEVAARTAGVAKLETDRGKLAEMSNEAFAEHVGAVAEAAEAAGAPLPPARLSDPKQLSEMSDQEFRAYSIALLSAPARLEAAPRKRQLTEALDVDNLASLSESARVAAKGGPTLTEAGEKAANESILEAHRSALRSTGRARSPFWR